MASLRPLAIPVPMRPALAGLHTPHRGALSRYGGALLVEPSQDNLTALPSALSERQRRVLSLHYGLQDGTPLSFRRLGTPAV